MPRTGKVIAHHRHGKGLISSHQLTVLRPGPIGDTGASKAAADMFVDVAPYISLRGLDIERTYDRRGNTMRDGDESHIQQRTRGKRTGKLNDARSHHVEHITAKGQFGKPDKKNGR